jgi:hypothetical protein
VRSPCHRQLKSIDIFTYFFSTMRTVCINSSKVQADY